MTALAEAGGWVVTVFLLIVFAWGFHKEWWVPGRVHQRELERGKVADDALKAAAEAHESSASGMANLTHAFEDMADMLYEDAQSEPRSRPKRRRRRREPTE